MDRVTGGGMLSFDNVNMHAVESLFHSEGFYWLSTAVATGVDCLDRANYCTV